MSADALAIAELCRAQARDLRHTAARLGNDPLFMHMANSWERDAERWAAKGRASSA